MRKSSVWVLCGLMGLTTAVFAAAQTGTMGTESGSMGDMSKDSSMSKTTTTKHHAAKGHSATGEVTAVDATAKTMTIKAKSGDMNFMWDDKTTVAPKGKTASDISMGTKVTVSYKMSGDNKMATKVMIHAAKAAKMDAAAPKTPSK